MRAVGLVAAGLAFGWSAALCAEEGERLSRGTRIKVLTTSEAVVGSFAWVTNDALGIARTGQAVESIPRSSVLRVQRYAGKRASLPGVAVGAVAFAIPFGAIGAMAGSMSGAFAPPNMNSGGENNARNGAITMAAIGGGIGALVGGKRLWRRDAWEDAHLGPQGGLVAVPMRGGFVIAARLSF
jgi:hypothetical protein